MKPGIYAVDIQAQHVDAAWKSIQDEEEFKFALERLVHSIHATAKVNIGILAQVGEVLHHYRTLHATDPEQAYQIARKRLHRFVDDQITKMIRDNNGGMIYRIRHTQGTAPAIKGVVDYGLKLYRESL